MEIYSLRKYLLDQKDELGKQSGGADSNLYKLQDEFLRKMDLLRKYAEESYYGRIQRLYPWFTDHGQKHVDSILNMVSEMLQAYNKRLNAFEIFILYAAVIYHDTGMMKSREKHGPEMKEVFKNLSDYIGSREIESIITKIAEAHTGNFDKLERLSTQHPISYNSVQEEVDARALASLLRFADEVSETIDRIDTRLLDEGKVPEDSLIFWEYANCIKLSRADPKSRKIRMKISIKNSVFFTEYAVPQKDGSTRKMPFIEYLLERLDKMDTERRNCCANFRHMASIDTIEIEMKIVDENNDEIPGVPPIEIDLNEKYCERSNFRDSFYAKNPAIKDKDEYQKKLFSGGVR